MEILDGDAAGLERACRCIIADPQPDHLEEERIAQGTGRGMAELIAESLAASEFAVYAERDGAAFAGGVCRGLVCREIWMLASAGAETRPRWLLAASRRLLGEIERRVGRPAWLVQVIPESYGKGVGFAERLGFKRNGTRPGAAGTLWEMEKGI